MDRLPTHGHSGLPSGQRVCQGSPWLARPGTVLAARPASFRVTLLQILTSSVHSAPTTSERFQVPARLRRVPLREARLSSPSLTEGQESNVSLSPSLHFR